LFTAFPDLIVQRIGTSCPNFATLFSLSYFYFHGGLCAGRDRDSGLTVVKRRVLRMPLVQKERHRTSSMGWLRAAVLGANDGIVSTASLVLGVAAANATRSNVLVAGVAGLVAGAMAMAAGEYVSVHSQADSEQAELERERAELKADDKGEHEELTAIYVARGLDPSLAKQVADQLMTHDAIGAHARDELGITEALRARPIQAALASALSFAVGAAMPLLTAALVPEASLVILVPGTSLLFLALLGALAAGAGGAGVAVGAIRVTFWGALAMGLTAGVGALFGTVV
jgi:vacuolar iron transporter family protein